eukprot:6304571-Pyramimonas_sp.AAC.1
MKILADGEFMDTLEYSAQRFFVMHQYRLATKRAKAAIRADKKANAEVLAVEAERLLFCGDTRGAFKIAQSLAPKTSSSAATLKLNGQYFWRSQEEIEAKAIAMKEIFEAEDLPLHEE